MRHAKDGPAAAGIDSGYARTPKSWPPSARDNVLFVGTDDALLAACRAVAAAAGVGLDQRETAPEDAQWFAAPLVLLSAGCPARPPRRPGVVVVARAPVGEGVWHDAVDLGAEHVAVLPEADRWLARRMVEAVEARQAQGRVVGVVGGCGGAGASVLASVLAGCAAVRGLECLLVDADPLGGGIDLVLGAEELPGMRWQDLHSVRGRLQPGMLTGLLPQVDGVGVLSFGRLPEVPAGPPPDAMRAVLASARAQAQVVVVDLPRYLRPGDEDATGIALAACDVVLLVVPTQVRAVAAASQVLAGVTTSVADVRLVVRRSRGGLDPGAVTQVLAIPLAGVLASDAALASALERGEPAGLNARGSVRRTCMALLDDLLAAGAPSSSSRPPAPRRRRRSA